MPRMAVPVIGTPVTRLLSGVAASRASRRATQRGPSGPARRAEIGTHAQNVVTPRVLPTPLERERLGADNERVILAS